MQISMDYGKTGLSIEVPDRNLSAVLGLRPAPPLSDPTADLRAALRNPIGSPPLRQLARNRQNACILVCDITRPVPNQVILPPLLEEIEDAGIPSSRTDILIATGLHRPSTPDEIYEMLGTDIPRRYRVSSHDARDCEGQRMLGTTSSGVPVHISRQYLAADLKLSTGLIEPHLMAGFSGGRKVICPGVAGIETIRHFHGFTILESNHSTAGAVEGNPVHALSLEVARMAGCDFIVNSALDEERRITGLFAGHMEDAWSAGVKHVRGTSQSSLSEPVDIVVTSSAGYPLDSTFYQSVKGIVGALPAVKQGGTVILLASMKEGLGSPEFQSLLHKHRCLEDLMQTIEKPGFFSIDQWQAQELGKAARRARIVVFSDDIPREELNRALVTTAVSPEVALKQALEIHGSEATIAVIPRGPYVLPVVGAS